jgi:hypothetical protein
VFLGLNGSCYALLVLKISENGVWIYTWKKATLGAPSLSLGRRGYNSELVIRAVMGDGSGG